MNDLLISLNLWVWQHNWIMNKMLEWIIKFWGERISPLFPTYVGWHETHTSQDMYMFATTVLAVFQQTWPKCGHHPYLLCFNNTVSDLGRREHVPHGLDQGQGCEYATTYIPCNLSERAWSKHDHEHTTTDSTTRWTCSTHRTAMIKRKNDAKSENLLSLMH